MSEIGPWLALLVGGAVAGWINTLAGAGGLVALPVLMLWGLPADVANGTARVGVIAQGATGALGFWRAGTLPVSGLLPGIGITVLGAIGGSATATVLPDAVFEPLLLATLLAVAAAIIFGADRFLPAPEQEPRPLDGWSGLGLLAAGFYGGLIQAGVGLVLLAVLSGLLRYDLVRGNAIKVAATLCFNVAALAVFAASGLVAWKPGAILAVGNMVGAWLGVRFAIKRGAAAIRIVIGVAAIGGCIILLVR